MKYTRSMLRGYDKREGQYIAQILHIPPKKQREKISFKFKVKKVKKRSLRAPIFI